MSQKVIKVESCYYDLLVEGNFLPVDVVQFGGQADQHSGQFYFELNALRVY